MGVDGILSERFRKLLKVDRQRWMRLGNFSLIPMMVVLCSCGYQSVNRLTPQHCYLVEHIKITTPPGYGDLKYDIARLARKEFGAEAKNSATTTLRVNVLTIGDQMSGFTRMGALANTSLRIRVSADLLEGTRLLWHAETEPTPEFVQHVGNSRVTTMNLNAAMRTLLSEALKDLGRQFRLNCSANGKPEETS